MEDLRKYVEAHADTLVSDVEMLREKDESEILSYIGNMLAANSYTVSGEKSGSVIVPAETFNLQRSFDAFFPKDGIAKGITVAEAEGMSFKKRLEHVACTDKTLYKLFGDNENESVKKVVKEGLPIVVAALGGSIGGFWLAVAAAAIALLLKLGYKTYCAGYWKINGEPQAGTDPKQ